MPPVTFVRIQLLCLRWMNNSFTCLVKSKTVKQVVSPTVTLPLMVSVLWIQRCRVIEVTKDTIETLQSVLAKFTIVIYNYNSNSLNPFRAREIEHFFWLARLLEACDVHVGRTVVRLNLSKSNDYFRPEKARLNSSLWIKPWRGAIKGDCD